MTKIDIISGFLGAGKTTLIKKLLKEALSGEKVALVENEFGEIGIDGGFLKDAGIQITEMNSGCICCSLVGDFRTALRQMLDQYTLDRIIIEPTGVGKLSDVIKAVQAVAAEREDVVMNVFATVADANKCKMYHTNFGEFYNDQILSAGTVILSRTGMAKQDKIEAASAIIREINPNCAIITTDWDALTGEMILNVLEQNASHKLIEDEDVCPVCGHHHHHDDDDDDEEECCHGHHHHHDDDDDDEECCHGHHHHHDDDDDDEEECCCGHDHDHEHHHHHHHHHADDVFTSWGIETAAKYEKSRLEDILKKLSASDEYGMILRAKGIVPSPEGEWFYFDLVPGEYEIRTGAADYTGRLCVIGSKLDEEAIAKLFQ